MIDTITTELPEFKLADLQHDHSIHIRENTYVKLCSACNEYWPSQGRVWGTKPRRTWERRRRSACKACRENT